MSPPRIPGAGVLGAAAACLAAIVLYAALRAVQLFKPEPNPATVIWSAHSGYFWRVWTALFAAGMVGLVTYLLARRDPERVTRALPAAVIVVTIVITLQALLAP